MNRNCESPRILLVENEKRVRKSYEVLLRYWGYDPVSAEGEGNALIKDAIAKARKAHCILALIDLRLFDDFDEEDTRGLKLTEEIGPIKSIILSGYPNQKILREILERHKDIPFLSKSDAPEKIKQTLDTEVRKVCAGKRGLQIDSSDHLAKMAQDTFGSLIEEYPDQVADILAQLFPSATSIKIEKLDSNSTVSHVSTVPRPNSIVLKVYEGDLEPVVVKIARAGKIEIEVERYENYVFRRLPGSFMARLERHARLWDIGGALYTYIGDFDVKTFSRYYEEHTSEDIRDCLHAFFTVSWGRHYERKQEKSNISLFALYETVWGNWYEKKVKNFAPAITPHTDDISEKLRLPDPIKWFKQKIVENKTRDVSIVDRTLTAVTHGDLHGDNLLIDSRKNTWVIDFERTMEGHVLQDFIELESDILNRLQAYNEDRVAYYQMCLTVARQTRIKELNEYEMASADPGVRKALQTISNLRALALKCTGIRDARQYLLGLLFNTIFRATINNEEKFRDRQSRALTLAAIFCHRLDHWNEPWPPEEWMSILQSQEESHA